LPKLFTMRFFQVIQIALFSIAGIIIGSCTEKDSNESSALTNEEPITIEKSDEATFSISDGQELALSTQKVLGQNLMKALGKGGPEYAIEFCSTKAIHLTDSMGKELNASIRRVSDKPRNPKNAADSYELEIIKQFKESLSKGEEMKVELTSDGDFSKGYYPIITNGMCLQCHGTPKTQINQTTLDKIKSKYPNDKATGYAENQIRGIWVIAKK
jgi:hypothetical protein